MKKFWSSGGRRGVCFFSRTNPRMHYCRNTFAAISIALTLAACGGGGLDGLKNTPVTEAPVTQTPVTETPVIETPVVTPDPEPTGPAGLMLLADGITLQAATVTSTGYAETGSAEIPSTDLATDHQIFGVVVHPNKKWVYVASASRGWGNARLSRFAIDWTTGALSYVDAISMTSTGPTCASSDRCAPVGLGITDSGTRLIVEENSLDTFLTYAIGTDGALSYVAEAASGITLYHGVGINAAGTYVYHGSRAYTRAADVITELNNPGSTVGNASVVLNLGGAELLYTTLDTSEVAVLDLADAANPATIAALNPDPLGGGASTVFMDVTKNGKRILAVGEDSIAVVDFDGTALTVKYQSAVTGRARGAAFNADGTLAVISFQTGGAKLYTVAADGTLAEVGAVTSASPTRVVVFATRP